MCVADVTGGSDLRPGFAGQQASDADAFCCDSGMGLPIDGFWLDAFCRDSGMGLPIDGSRPAWLDAFCCNSWIGLV
ncbi:MAG: hypothetical protein EBZ76_05265, partial [Synechococcaceae bacterium WB9_2_170]|nr:hypothetical protein [Synechococcaceae bacterium WB9_2_170]